MDITEKPMGKLKDGAKRFSQNAVQIDNGQQSQGMFLLILMAATGLQEHPSLPPRALSLSPLKLGSFSKFLAFGCSSHLSPRLLWGRRADSTGNLRNHVNLCLGPQPLPGFLSDSDGKEYAYNEADPGLIPRSRRSPGEGNGNPLQYSCLENPKDKRVRWGTAQKVAKSWTWLKDQHFHFWLLPDCGFPSSWPEGEPHSLYLVIGGELFLHWFWLFKKKIITLEGVLVKSFKKAILPSLSKFKYAYPFTQQLYFQEDSHIYEICEYRDFPCSNLFKNWKQPKSP